MSLMDKMMDYMLGKMGKEEKQAMMDKMMEGVNMMEIMPKMMTSMMGGGKGAGGMMGTMSKIMEDMAGS